MSRFLLFLLSLLPASGFAAVLHSCDFGDGGDNLNRGFYVSPFGGQSLDDVTLALATDVDGSYEITLTATAGTFDGTVIGSDQAAVDLTGDFAQVVWNFANAAVTPGTTVAFAFTLDSGPGTASQVFFDIGTGELGAETAICPDLDETDSTTPPLGEFRRDTVGVIITGDEAVFVPSASVPALNPVGWALLVLSLGLLGWRNLGRR